MNDDYLLTDTPFAHFTRRTFLGVLLTAVVASILTFILTLAIDKVVLQPAICRADGIATCAQSAELSYHIASIIAGIVALVLLVQASVYRPLLVVLAVTISMWGIFGAFLGQAPWPLQLLGLLVLTTLAYFAFTWLLRTYNFVIALISSLVLAILTLVVTNL